MGTVLTWIQNSADHSGKNHQKHGQDLEVAREYSTALAMRYVLCRQRTLDDELKKRGTT